MRKASETEAVEKLLRALYEGTATDCPWVQHNGVAWEMQELSYLREADLQLPYLGVLFALAGPEARAVTAKTARAVRNAAERLLALIEQYDAHTADRDPEETPYAP